MISIRRRSEIEFLKIMSVINAIISVGNTVAASMSDSGAAPSSDSLNKTLESLREVLLPHLAEDSKRKAKKYEVLMKEELDRGPLKIKIVGKDSGQKRR